MIAIDGKVLRRSFDRASESSPIHMVSAFASEARLVLAQEKVEEKFNEITKHAQTSSRAGYRSTSPTR